MESQLQGYYGPIIENFECDENLFMAVEVTAGNRLFHHIVESDKLSTKILKEINKQKLPGEITFVSLNRINVKTYNYPDVPDKATPMIQKLNYEPHFDKAMR